MYPGVKQLSHEDVIRVQQLKRRLDESRRKVAEEGAQIRAEVAEARRNYEEMKERKARQAGAPAAAAAAPPPPPPRKPLSYTASEYRPASAAAAPVPVASVYRPSEESLSLLSQYNTVADAARRKDEVAAMSFLSPEEESEVRKRINAKALKRGGSGRGAAAAKKLKEEKAAAAAAARAEQERVEAEAAARQEEERQERIELREGRRPALRLMDRAIAAQPRHARQLRRDLGRQNRNQSAYDLLARAERIRPPVGEVSQERYRQQQAAERAERSSRMVDVPQADGSTIRVRADAVDVARRPDPRERKFVNDLSWREWYANLTQGGQAVMDIRRAAEVERVKQAEKDLVKRLVAQDMSGFSNEELTSELEILKDNPMMLPVIRKMEQEKAKRKDKAYRDYIRVLKAPGKTRATLQQTIKKIGDDVSEPVPAPEPPPVPAPTARRDFVDFDMYPEFAPKLKIADINLSEQSGQGFRRRHGRGFCRFNEPSYFC